MANLTQTLNLATGRGQSYSFSSSKSYDEIFDIIQSVDNTDGFINVTSLSDTVGTSTLDDINALVIHNTGSAAAEIQLTFLEYKNNSNVDVQNSVDLGGGSTATRFITFMLPAGEYIQLPNARFVGYNADASAANAVTVSNAAPDSNAYVDSGADLDTATSGDVASDATVTTIYLENGHTKYFRPNDLIRIDNEILRVTAVGTGADLANSTMTVERGLYGSTAATHSDDAAIRLPFFNTYNDFDHADKLMTDSLGRWWSQNFYGYGRNGDHVSTGVVPGSIAIKFYQPGYQEFGLSGITAGTNSGLTASTTYYFSCAVDGGTTDKITFTTDSSNVNFGGTNGVIQKIQDQFDAYFYNSAKNMFQDRVTIGIVNGDIRVTSGQHTSTSAIALTTNTDGTAGTDELFDGSNVIGRIPVSPEAAVAARLPDDTVRDGDSYKERPNTGAFVIDDGMGNLSGAGVTGTINYETGEVYFVGAPARANFVVSLNHDSAHAGGINKDSGTENCITTVAARSLNSKVRTQIRVLALN